ncbi:unnamed protein product [Prorocentrum cordatum]|uniref:STAS domain-containing protein n=1 Tax=Prorocentrum cordatum TaxID=2364126 RepID=A0ABN9X197_9DINO|nr:unnamed protein product [Polarella glacialis]
MEVLAEERSIPTPPCSPDSRLAARLLASTSAGVDASRKFHAGDVLSLILGPLLLVPFAVAFVGVIVSSNASLQADFPLLLSTVMMSQTVGTFCYWAFSQTRTCTNIDLLTAAFLAKLCILLRPFVSERDLFVHLCIGQGAFSVLVGLCLCLLARVDGMWYLRFLPYTVSSGFVTGIGLLIMDGGFELGSGHGMKELVTGVGSIPLLTYLHASATVLAGGVILSITHVIHNGLRLPVGLGVVTLLVHGIAALLGIDSSVLASNGFFIEGLTADPWTASWGELAARFHYLQPSAFLNTPVLSLTVSYAVMHVICWPFYASALAEVDMSWVGKTMSIRTEIMVMGATNVLVGFLGAVPCCHSIKVLVVMQDAGGTSKLWSLLLGVSFALLYFLSDLRVQLSAIPRCAFGGLVSSLGFEFIRSSLAESRARIAPAELRFVLITAVVTYFDVLTGLCFGLSAVAVFFIVEYAGMTGITRQASLDEVRSNMDRPNDEMSLLDRFGDRVTVFWLTGYIFFGCAVGVVEEVEAFIEQKQTVRYIVIDFEHVPAVDASGVHYLTNFASQCMSRDVPIRVCFSGMVRRLRLAVESAVKSKCVHGLKLDAHLAEEAISWAEEELIAAYSVASITRRTSTVVPTDPLPETSPYRALESFFAVMVPNRLGPDFAAVVSRLVPAVAIHKVMIGEQLFVEGSAALELIFVLHGKVVLMRSQRADEGCKLPTHHLNKEKGDVFVFEERSPVLVQHLSSKAVIGAAEYGLGKGKAVWSTSCTASCNCQVLTIPFANLSVALEETPSAGFAVVSRLAQLTSAHLVRLMRKSEPVPFSHA